MRVLIAHNQYQLAGGEDSVVEAESELLRNNGIDVHLYLRNNKDINAASRFKTAVDTVWSRQTVTEIIQLAKHFQPDIIHTHNTFPLMSPSIYYAGAKLKIPVVQTLHNFRLFCAQAMLIRERKVCEDCIGHLPWRAVLHRCYRDSAAQSAAVVGMLGVHRALGTYANKITRYIALNQFCRAKFIEGGLPAELISIKPNFVDIDAPPAHIDRRGALFVGRISEEKGIKILGQAAALRVRQAAEPVKIVGIGPQKSVLHGNRSVQLMGWQASEATYELMRSSSYLVMPSLWYENFPRTLVEAFACGLPVIASRLGAMAELIKHGETGLLFEPGDAEDLADKMLWADIHVKEMRFMGIRARQEYEDKYTPKKNFSELMEIYKKAIDDHRMKRAA
jgi:glycosyltransferase involved in cell wall biosynthesis